MRSVVKSEWAEVAIPEIEFEVKKQTGLITTVEGVLERAVEGLQHTIKAVSLSNTSDNITNTNIFRVRISIPSRVKRFATFWSKLML